jgi:uncharacterized membrane protein YfcA
MNLDTTGWAVAAFAVLITGISKSGLGGALGGLAVPFLSMWMSPRDAAAVMLPILITMDMVGIRAWRGKADVETLKVLIPGALLGIVLGTLAFGVLSDRAVKGAIGLIAVSFALDRLIRHGGQSTAAERPQPWLGWLSGTVAGVTSTLAHAGGPPIMIYLMSWRQPRETFVATAVFFFAVINLSKLPTYIGLGLFSWETLRVSAIMLPLVPLGVWIGMRVLKHIPEKPFYWFATLALCLSGLKLVFDAWMG